MEQDKIQVEATMGWVMISHPTVRTLRLALDELLTREVNEDDAIDIACISNASGTLDIRKAKPRSK